MVYWKTWKGCHLPTGGSLNYEQYGFYSNHFRAWPLIPKRFESLVMSNIWSTISNTADISRITVLHSSSYLFGWVCRSVLNLRSAVSVLHVELLVGGLKWFDPIFMTGSSLWLSIMLNLTTNRYNVEYLKDMRLALSYKRGRSRTSLPSLEPPQGKPHKLLL
jgi:hypothetical protein